MAWQAPEQDDDEERMAITMAPVMVTRIKALLGITLAPADAALVDGLTRRDPKTLTAEHRHWVQRLLWKYRRDLPRGVAPKLNPDDPIVREMEMTGA